MYATLDEWQILLLWRLRHADHVRPSEVHDFASLMGKDLDPLPAGWLATTYDAYQALGLLHEVSKAAASTYCGRLSPRARWLLDDINDDAA